MRDKERMRTTPYGGDNWNTVTKCYVEYICGTAGEILKDRLEESYNDVKMLNLIIVLWLCKRMPFYERH